MNLQRQSIERVFAFALDHVRGDLRIARGRRQIVMTEQNLNDPDVGSAFQEMGRDQAMAQRVQRDPQLVKPAALTADRQAACNTVGSIGCSSSRPGKR